MDDWDPLLVDALVEARPVILFDNAGIGRSGGQTPSTVTEMAETAAAFIATVVDTPVDVLGYMPATARPPLGTAQEHARHPTRCDV
ncbi:alpha/beta fold hydrolase [Streptomyces sp. NPDC096354]|uniref:alpha/beta fold hydrolase n=1 Tax=Streptomyces sp. NPDC096354 TaxID=3366088 RepID=UPI0038247C79